MEYMAITGNGPIRGEVAVSGAKNAALPALCATLLADGICELSNIPQVEDVATLYRLLAGLGLRVTPRRESVRIDSRGTFLTQAPTEPAKAMRASILALGPLLARHGQARLALPGGCAIGARPVDLHLQGLRAMGATIHVVDGVIEAWCDGLVGTDFTLATPTVTGTENLMMAATLARGRTILRGAAREPEVVDLAELLITMGARISGHGSETLVIDGCERLHGTQYRIIPDRIEAGTWICAAAITGGAITVKSMQPKHLHAFLRAMAQAGLPMRIGADAVQVLPHRGLTAVDITTLPHPEFPTDLQAQFMATMTLARGGSLITETIFESRFKHAKELERMGADIRILENRALVTGPVALRATTVKATDLRASACLVLAALAADGETRIEEIHHLDRGYAHLVEKLAGLGVKVRRGHCFQAISSQNGLFPALARMMPIPA